MIYITGDTHGEIDISKINGKYFKEQKYLTSKDFLIIAGDFGVIWEDNRTQKYWLNWLEKKSFTTLFIDGNHENFDLINSYIVENWNGGVIHKINNKVIHLMRGQIYSIDNTKIFTFGGGESTDKNHRIEGISWWKEEMPSYDEYGEGLKNLEKNNWNVDYIVTHTAPSNIISILEENHEIYNKKNELSDYFEQISKKVKFKKWFFGHYHLDKIISNEFYALYQNKLRIE